MGGRAKDGNTCDLSPKNGTSQVLRTRAHVLGPRGRPGPGPRANAYSNNYISGGRPPIRGDTWYVHVLRRGSICPPHQRVAPRAKYKPYLSRGGSPEAAVDGVVSLRPRGSQGQLKFSRAFPLRGTHRKFHERSAPKSGGGLRFITPCGDVRFTFNVCWPARPVSLLPI